MYNVLSINQKYKVIGGSDRYYFNLNELLLNHGNEVVEFACYDKSCFSHENSDSFPKVIDYNKHSVKSLCKYLYNFEAKDLIGKLISSNDRFDLAHLQIYYGQITSSILGVLKKKNIPIIQTLHEYKLSCPVYTHISNDTICEKCISGSSINCIVNKCKSNSYANSLVRYLEFNLSRILGDVNLIDRFICVSKFQKNKMIEAGVPEKKLEVVYNFVPSNNGSKEIIDGDYLLYFGRLEKLKGVHTLIKAMANHLDKRLVVAGDGPYRESLIQIVKENKLTNVDFVGFISGDALWDMVHKSKAIMVPSEWYENCSMTVLEGKSYSKPIVASSIGGITEQIDNNINGFLHEPGNPLSIAEAITRLYSSDYSSLCSSSRNDLENRYSSEVHYLQLESIYDSVVNG